MSDVDALSERIDALEMRLTYQDVTIETLNQTITAQWIEIDRLTRQVAELKERLQDAESNRPVLSTNRRRITEESKRNGLRDGGRFMHSNSVTGARIIQHREPDRRGHPTATIAAHTTGETFLLLPLRGELFAAWLNSVFIACSVERCQRKTPHLVPQRLIFAIAIRLRRRRLRGAHGIGRRKTIHQTLLELLVDFAVGQHRLAGIGGVLVMRRRVEFLSHRVPPLQG